MTKTLSFCRGLPKIELHAHINGCIRIETLKKLAQGKADGEQLTARLAEIDRQDAITLDNVFELFGYVHAIIDNRDTLFKATCQVIKDFADDNIKYLELRSTPKCLSDCSKMEYIKTVHSAVSSSTDDIIVRLLVSLDRKRGLQEAAENVDLAIRARNMGLGVVGVELSGDPLKEDARSFIPLFQKARDAGLKVSVHLAEHADKLDEVMDVLRFGPDRIGHGTFLERVPGAVELVLARKIPLELCLTSNVLCKTVLCYPDHHLTLWKRKDHPFVICSDDTGMFKILLSNEYAFAIDECGLSRGDVIASVEKSVDYVFDESVVNMLKKQLSIQ